MLTPQHNHAPRYHPYNVFECTHNWHMRGVDRIFTVKTPLIAVRFIRPPRAHIDDRWSNKPKRGAPSGAGVQKMSSLGRDTILTIAESIGIAKVRDAVADALARDIEEKVRELAEV